MFIRCAVMQRRFSAALSTLYTHLRASQFGFIAEKFALALFISVFTLGGATIGAIAGAIKGNTTETGLLRGFIVGAVGGAITGVQLMELIANGEPFSKAALAWSVVDGKAFAEWVSPAILKAYQWETSSIDVRQMEVSDIFDVHTIIKGLSQASISELLPIHVFCNVETSSSTSSSCAICLQDLEDGDSGRMLPSCMHFFHLHCIDEWLMLQATCPVCRKDV